MSSRGAVKQLAPPKKAAPKAVSQGVSKAPALAKAAAVKGKPAVKAARPSPAKAPSKPAPKAAARPAAAPKPAQRPLAAVKPVARPALVHPAVKPSPPQPRPAPVAAPRPPVVAAHLSPPQLQKKPALPGPVAAPPRPAPKPQPTLARSYFFNDLRVGDDLPPLQKPPVDRVQIARYAVEAHDYNRLHLDEPYAAALGFRTVFAPGALAMGFVAQLVSQWLKRGLVRKLQARFVKIVRPGDELTCRGRVADKRREKSACLADLELWAENQKGELVLRGQATCELLESPELIPGEGGLLTGTPRSQAQRPGQPAPRSPAPLPKKK